MNGDENISFISDQSGLENVAHMCGHSQPSYTFPKACWGLLIGTHSSGHSFMYVEPPECNKKGAFSTLSPALSWCLLPHRKQARGAQLSSGTWTLNHAVWQSWIRSVPSPNLLCHPSLSGEAWLCREWGWKCYFNIVPRKLWVTEGNTSSL